MRIYRIPCQVFETLSARVYLLRRCRPAHVARRRQQPRRFDRADSCRHRGGPRAISARRCGPATCGALSSLTATSITSGAAGTAANPAGPGRRSSAGSHGRRIVPHARSVASTVRLDTFFHRAGVEACATRRTHQDVAVPLGCERKRCRRAAVGRRRRTGRAANPPHARPFARPRLHPRGQRAPLRRPHPVADFAALVAGMCRGVRGPGALSGVDGQDRAARPASS